MDLFDAIGPGALGSRLRRFTEQMTSQAAAIYALYHLPLEPRWFPVFYTVATEPGRHVGDIAAYIGQTHAAVSQVVKELVRHELVQVQRGQDQRRSVVTLAAKGAALWPLLQQQMVDVHQASEALLAETRHNLWLALGEMEYALAQQNMPQRVKAIRDARIAGEVTIVPFERRFKADFKQLNAEWIEHYFHLEAADLQVLDHPEEYILQRGGHILMARYQERTVGTCALLRLADGSYELAKMAVSPTAQGLGIGLRLAQAAIEKARILGAWRLYLESNTQLTTALRLYHKLGFQKTVAGQPSPYERSNIQMELLLPS